MPFSDIVFSNLQFHAGSKEVAFEVALLKKAKKRKKHCGCQTLRASSGRSDEFSPLLVAKKNRKTDCKLIHGGVKGLFLSVFLFNSMSFALNTLYIIFGVHLLQRTTAVYLALLSLFLYYMVKEMYFVSRDGFEILIPAVPTSKSNVNCPCTN